MADWVLSLEESDKVKHDGYTNMASLWLLRRFLPTPVVPTLPPKPVPTELERMLQRLLMEVQTQKPTLLVKSGITDLETLLQGLLPGIPAPAPRVRPGPIRRDWATIISFYLWQGATWSRPMSRTVQEVPV